MKKPPPPHEPLLSPAEVGDLLRVGPRTVARWADLGRFPAGAVIRTPQGHRRYVERVIRAWLAGAR